MELYFNPRSQVSMLIGCYSYLNLSSGACVVFCIGVSLRLDYRVSNLVDSGPTGVQYAARVISACNADLELLISTSRLFLHEAGTICS